jgi:hypothetical protein
MSKKYHTTMTSVLAWANSELEHVGRIAALEDADLQYSYALSTVNGMMHLRDALFEMVSDPKYKWKREELLRTHDSVVRVLKHLVSEYNVNLGTIRAFNTRGVLSKNSYRLTRSNRRRQTTRRRR